MDWSDLATLLAVARRGSLNGAAESLGVNQTTVSRRIDALEEETGTLLLERRRTGTRLTAAGEEAARAAEQMEDVAHGLERVLVGGDAKLSGSLRVTTTDALAAYESELFSSFARRYPDVDLVVSTAYAQLSLSQRAADVALRWTNQPDASLFGRKLVRAHYAIYCAKKLRRKVRGRQLEKFPWLAWDPGSGARITERWMEKHVPEAKVLCRFDSALAMHAAIAEGAGIAFMPCAFGDGRRDLVRLGEVEEELSYDIWCLTHPDLSGSARVRAFMSHAGEYFEAASERYRGRTGRTRSAGGAMPENLRETKMPRRAG